MKNAEMFFGSKVYIGGKPCSNDSTHKHRYYNGNGCAECIRKESTRKRIDEFKSISSRDNDLVRKAEYLKENLAIAAMDDYDFDFDDDIEDM